MPIDPTPTVENLLETARTVLRTSVLPQLPASARTELPRQSARNCMQVLVNCPLSTAHW